MTEDHRPIPVMVVLRGRVAAARVPRVGSRWLGGLLVELETGARVHLLMPGAIARWLLRGERVEVRFLEESESVNGVYVAPKDSYEL